MVGAIFLALFLGCGVAALYTVHNLTKSNELGNSKSTLAELGGDIIIVDKKDSVGSNYQI